MVPDYKKLLNKKDPLDRLILNLAKQGELKVGVVWVKEENEHPSEQYLYKHLHKNIWKNYQKENLHKLFNLKIVLEIRR